MDTDGTPPTCPWIVLWSPVGFYMLYFCQLIAAIFRGLSFGYWNPFGCTCMEQEAPGSLCPPQGSLWPLTDWCGRVKAQLFSLKTRQTLCTTTYRVRLGLWLDLKLLPSLASFPYLSSFCYTSTGFSYEFCHNKSPAHRFSCQGHPLRTGPQTAILEIQYHMNVAFSPPFPFEMLNTSFLIA